MKIIETKLYEPIPNKPGYVREIGQRKASDVFNELKERLLEADLLPDEYFLMASEMSKGKDIFPDFVDLCCYANWGTSEGIYLDICLILQEEGKIIRKSFATGKTLEGNSEAFDRMQYTAGYITKLFFGDHGMSPRYRLLKTKEKPTQRDVLNRVEHEYRDYLKTLLIHKRASAVEHGMEIGLKSMILSALPNCHLTDEKIGELMVSENALNLLTNVCSCIDQAILYDIKDCISSCDTFVA